MPLSKWNQINQVNSLFDDLMQCVHRTITSSCDTARFWLNTELCAVLIDGIKVSELLTISSTILCFRWSKVVYTNAYFMLWNCERLDGRGDHPCQYTITLPYSMPFSVQYLFCNQISWSMKLYGLFIFAFRNFSNGPLFMQHYFTRTLHNFLCSNMIFTKWHLLMTREALKIHVHVHI